jgi:glycogen synthase
MAIRVHRPLNVVAFNANGIGKQHFELRKHLQDHHIDVALLFEAYLKPHERFFISNYHVYQTSLSRLKRQNCHCCQKRYPT